MLAKVREDEARSWFARTVDVDEEGQTDAQDRLLELDGVVFDDLQAGDDLDESTDEDDLDDPAPTAGPSTQSVPLVTSDVSPQAPAGEQGELRLFD